MHHILQGSCYAPSRAKRPGAIPPRKQGGLGSSKRSNVLELFKHFEYNVNALDIHISLVRAGIVRTELTNLFQKGEL